MYSFRNFTLTVPDELHPRGCSDFSKQHVFVGGNIYSTSLGLTGQMQNGFVNE